ncbi:MAG: hypothetical protein D6812_05450, partial [Deltaproteobacteria bacterium]
MADTLSPEQRKAVEAKGSVAVVAGAGTGKTFMLTRRYLHHLLVDGHSPLEVVAVTFTEKAAAELRARIRREVASAAPERFELTAEVEAAQISTIHALAARICREHPEAAGVPADFSILDEREGTIWRIEQLEAALDHLPPEIFDEIPYSLLREVMEVLTADPVSAEEALSRSPEAWDESLAEAREELRGRLVEDPRWEGVRETIVTLSGRGGDRLEETRREALAAVSLLAEPPRFPEALQRLSTLDLRGGSRKAWGEADFSTLKEALRACREVARAYGKRYTALLPNRADERLRACHPRIVEAWRSIDEALSAQRRRARLLGFPELERHALRALSHEEVRRWYAERWRAILVDEFQDTNPVQARIIEALAQGATLTIVGDEKQSIYAFRRADVTVFRRFREKIVQGGGSVVSLSRSFRAHAPLIERIEAISARMLGELHQPLTAVRPHAPDAHPAVEFHFVDEGEGNVRKDLKRRVEAEAIAERIGEIVEGGMLLFDRQTQRVRPACYGDIAILSRAWEPLDHYVEALEEAGIPAVHAGGGNLLETSEGKDIRSLLTFLADRRNDLSLAAVLRSPFFTVSDRDLLAFAREVPPGTSWWAHLEATQAPALLRARGVLRELRHAARRLAPSALVERADRRTGYSAVIANLPGAARRRADWKGMLALLRELERQHCDTGAIVRRIERMCHFGIEIPRPALEAHDAVLLTTIHDAKGLEWPVVFLPDLARGTPPRWVRVSFDPAIGVSFPFVGEGGEVEKPAIHALMAERAREREAAEERRILYVALTRARDRLILTATDRKGGRLSWFFEILEGAGIPIGVIPFDPGRRRRSLPLSPTPPSPPECFLTEPLQASIFEVPATGLGEYDLCPKRFRFRFLEGHPGVG